MIEAEYLDKKNIEILHEQLFWEEDGTIRDRGFFPDGVRQDRALPDALSSYRFEQPFAPRQPVQPFIQSLEAIYNASTYDLIGCNCQDFMDALRAGLR